MIKNLITGLLAITLLIVVIFTVTGCQEKIENYPDPSSNDQSPVMLVGDWFEDPHNIDFDALPRVPKESIVVSDVTPQDGVNQHNYLIHYDGLFWAMWSDGPSIEDKVGQVVKYATSEDGRTWSEPLMLTPYPPDSGPESLHYNTRTEDGFRYIARGFWERDGELLALVTLDEAAGFFGPSLQLRAFRWNKANRSWEDYILVHDNTINNFPPKQLPGGEWLMSRRAYDYTKSGVHFLVGGTKAIDQWESFPVFGSASQLSAEEPYWWVLPDGKSLMALFRDNNRSGYLYRSFSIDNGRTWSHPVQTDFPDARSKFHGLRMSNGQYVLVNNSYYENRKWLTLSVSDDGMVFDKMFFLVEGDFDGVDYPHVMEHEGYLYVAHSGGKGGRKQSVEVERIQISDLENLEMPSRNKRH
ncbi:exo-alpha-sialidase [Membranicola marinus]|uniref:Exo-alpha-sialidase n=1 Tax=Membranihabitans marinus TaxID=1227546 RepID=A0A953HVY2_9BACT|nr:exo-alpha-sialidase [Membranihabitans marinus]MBY5956777.1 exo-alpha-sialidase [Membranihabitans marinus]